MKKVLLVIGFFLSILFYSTLAITKNAGEYKREIESKFKSSQTIIHSTSSNFIDIENKSSQILIDTSDYDLDIVFLNEKFGNLAKEKCEEYIGMTFNGHKERVRTLSTFRAKFYCLSLEEDLLIKIENAEWFIFQCKNNEALKGDPSCNGREQELSNLKLDLKDLRENQNNQPSISTEDQNTVVAASSGTGFFVSTNGHMVTNNHVIEGCDTVKAHYKGRELDANVLFTDRSNDLAIIKANIKPEKVFPVSNEDVSLLEDIIVAGYPLGKNISASIKTFKGSVTALAGFGDNFSNFQIDASLSSGNSGGPIINQKGNVVGVAVEKLVEVGVEGFNFGVKSSTLKTFASSNQIKFQDPSTEELSNKELGQLITEATIYLECWMSVAKIKQIIQEGERQKAFFSEYK